MHRAVARECRTVRSAVGVFDATTLGKIEVVGPDAAEFLDRLYTGSFTRLAAGRCRYGVLLSEAGFPGGDRFLHAVANELASTFPAARVVRIHTDCFAVLFLPSGDATLTEADFSRARAALEEAAASFRAREPALRRTVDFTIGGLSLRIVDPSHWQVLGPLLWGELERAHVLARRGDAEGIQRREIHLDGRLPAPGAQVG